jgi:hypothetical protein
MAAYELATLEAQVDALDQVTARRVARLVLECGSSLALALQAVQEADQTNYASAAQPARPTRRRSSMRSFIGAR